MANSTPLARRATPPPVYRYVAYGAGSAPAGARSAAYQGMTVSRVGFWRDVYNGAVLGDFVRAKRLPGAITQIALSFTPLVGTICAARDCIADVRYRDPIGFVLNLLALIPVFGGIPKTIEVVHSLWHVSHVLRTSRQTPRPVAYAALPTPAARPAQMGSRVKPMLLFFALVAALALGAGILLMFGYAPPFPLPMDHWTSMALCLALGLVAATCSWVAGLVRTGIHGRWGWFLAILFLNPLTTLLYAMLGPREARL